MSIGKEYVHTIINILSFVSLWCMYLSCSCVMFLICKPTRRLSFRNKELELFLKNEKAFNSVERETLWKILRLIEYLKKLVSLICNPYQGINYCSTLTSTNESSWSPLKMTDLKPRDIVHVSLSIIISWTLLSTEDAYI